MLVQRVLPLIVAVVALGACAPPPPPPLAPEPEPESAEIEPEPVAAERQEIPIEERIRAPFAVQSDGQPAPRESRRGLVVVDQEREGATVTLDDGDEATPAADAADDTGSATAPAASADAAASTAPPRGGTAPAPGARREHVVQAGETFFAIARRYDVTAMALAAANPGVDNQRLRVGQVLRLPEGAASGRAPAAAASAAATPPRPAAQPRTHRVVAGETLWSIARRYGVTMAQIRTANRMTDDTVRVGQTLVIPSG